MATKGSILQIMHASGVTPIPTAEGVRHFLNEVAMPGIRECVVAGELGAIDADQQVVDKAWDVACEVANTVVKDQAERFRLLDKVVACTPDTSLDAEVRMDQAVHPYARDHRVDGVPYLPGVYGLESFAEAASLLVPEGQVLTKAKDVRFALPLKQLKATPATGTVSCKVISRTEQTTTVACKLTSRFVGPDGRAHGEPKLHFEGTLVFGSVPLRVRAAVPGTTKELDQSGIYPPFFHGPSFQVLDMAGPIGEASVARMAQPDTPPFEGSVRFQAHPMVVEALFQACGLRTLVKENAMSLPAGIAEAEFLQPGPVPKGVVLVGRPTGRDAANQRTFDAEAIAPDGTVLVRLKGYAMVETGPAPQSRKTNGVHANGSGSHARAPDVQLHAAGPAASSVSSAGSSSVAAATHAGTSAASTAVTATSHTEIPDAGLALPQSDDIHFAAVRVTEGAAAEPHWFTAAEVAKHKSFPAPKRADEWRAGRLAAKKAVTETHRGLSPLDVEVHADESSGRPRLMVKGKEAALWLSITHRDGIAMAALSPAPVGIDLETVEDRPKSFLEESFCLNELRALLDAANPQVDVACMWAAKEAVLKRIGIGLKTDLRSHEVRADGKGGATVESPTGIHGVRFYDVDGRVLAVSSPVHDLATASAR